MLETEEQIKAKIDKAVFDANLKLLSRIISTYLLQNNRSKESRIFGALSYRRLGANKKALKVLDVKFKPSLWDNIPDLDLQLQIQAIQILAVMGALGVALKLAEKVPASRRHLVLPQLAVIYMNCGEFEKALDCNQEFSQNQSDPNSRTAVNTSLRMGACFGLLEDWKSAKSLLSKLIGEHPHDQATQVYAHICLLIALVLGNRADEAERVGQKTLSLLPPAEKSTALGDTREYYGAALALLGRYEEARAELEHAFEKLYRPGFSPSSWLGIFYWKGLIELGLNQCKKFPTHWVRIVVYPQQTYGRYKNLIARKMEIPKSILMDFEKVQSRISKSVHYDLASETVIRGYGTASCRYQLGFDLLDNALIALVLAGSYGISEYALFDHLWKGDFAVGQCHQRLSQLVKRLRAQGYPVTWESGQLSLKKYVDITCAWSAEKKPLGWLFLEKHPRFSRKKVESFFSISKSQAVRVCNCWLKEKTIVKDPVDRSLFRVVGRLTP